MSQHAKLSPSGAKIWMVCSGQPALAAKFKNRSGPYADKGTDAHWGSQSCIEGHVTLDQLVGMKGPKGTTLDKEDVEAIGVYVDFVESNVEPDDEWGIEDRLRYNDDIWGTADFWRYRPSTRNLLIADYKHGKGVSVEVAEEIDADTDLLALAAEMGVEVPEEADGNPQALIYGLMKLKNLSNRGVDTVTLAIVQPRAFHPKGPIREWTFSTKDLAAFEAEMLAAAAATRAENAPLVAGTHCRWCPAAAMCPVLVEKARSAKDTTFAAGLPYDPAKLSAALADIPLIQSWIKSTREFAYYEATEGRPPPGHKLVQKQARPKWINEVEAGAALELLLPKDEIYVTKLLPPGKMEKALGKTGKAQLAAFISRQSSGLTLVHESDKRPAAAARATAQEDFGA